MIQAVIDIFQGILLVILIFPFPNLLSEKTWDESVKAKSIPAKIYLIWYPAAVLFVAVITGLLFSLRVIGTLI